MVKKLTVFVEECETNKVLAETRDAYLFLDGIGHDSLLYGDYSGSCLRTDTLLEDGSIRQEVIHKVEEEEIEWCTTRWNGSYDALWCVGGVIYRYQGTEVTCVPLDRSPSSSFRASLPGPDSSAKTGESDTHLWFTLDNRCYLVLQFWKIGTNHCRYFERGATYCFDPEKDGFGDRQKRIDVISFHQRLAGDPVMSMFPADQFTEPSYMDYVSAGAYGLYAENIHRVLLEILKEKICTPLGVRTTLWSLKAIIAGDHVCRDNPKHKAETERLNKIIMDGCISEGGALTVLMDTLRDEHESPDCDPKTVNIIIMVIGCLSFSALSNPILCATPFRQLMGSVLKRHKMDAAIVEHAGYINHKICNCLRWDNPRAADSYATQILNILIASLRMGIHTKDREVSLAAFNAILMVVKPDMSARLVNKKLHTLCVRALNAFPELESMTPALKLLTLMAKASEPEVCAAFLAAGVVKACRGVIGRYPKNTALVGTTLALLMSLKDDSALYSEGVPQYVLDTVSTCPQDGQTTAEVVVYMARVLVQAPESQAFIADPVTLTSLFNLLSTLDDTEGEGVAPLIITTLFTIIGTLYANDRSCLQDLQDVVEMAEKHHPEEPSFGRMAKLLETARTCDVPPDAIEPAHADPVTAGFLSILFGNTLLSSIASCREPRSEEFNSETFGPIGYTTYELSVAVPRVMSSALERALESGDQHFDPEQYPFGVCVEWLDCPPTLSMRQPHLQRVNAHRTLVLKSTFLCKRENTFAMVGRTSIGTTEEDQVYAPTYAALITAHSLLPPLLVPGTPLSLVEQMWHNVCRAHPNLAVGALVPYLSPYPVRPLWAVQMDEATLGSELDGVVVDKGGAYVVASMLSGLHTERDRSED
ncbi:hypothetical protein KIPB_002588, partial [Kipferlia bialata]|eukprot:g2588.t1